MLLAFGSVAIGSLMAVVYPFLVFIPIVIAVGVIEGALWAFTEPAMNSFLMEAVPDRRSEAQGVAGTAQSGSLAVGALIGGSLFAMGWRAFLRGRDCRIGFSLLALPGLRAAGRRSAPAGDLA
jgi:MFS family permease